MHVVILTGGPSDEHEVALRSAAQVAAHFPLEHTHETVVVNQDGTWQLPGNPAAPESMGLQYLKKKADMVFLALHGQWGEDGTVQGLLDRLLIPYTGSGTMASALAFDKEQSRKVFQESGLTVPSETVIFRSDWVASRIPRVLYPCVVKPATSGSSVGVSIVQSEAKFHGAVELAFTSSDRVLVQQYLVGTEVTASVLADATGIPAALPVIEIVPKVGFFDYTAKYTPGASDEIVPARMSPELTTLVQSLAIQAHEALGCQTYSRSDFILVDGAAYILETNTLPGLTAGSLIPKAAAAAGIDYTELIRRILGPQREAVKLQIVGL